MASALESICREVTKEILEEIKRGTKPWEAPWVGGDGPRNHRTLRHYTGINELILLSAAYNHSFKHHRWLTAKQAQAMGGGVRAGAGGTTIIFATRLHRPSENGRAMQEKRTPRQFGCARLYTVYNVEESVGIRQMREPPLPVHLNHRIEALVAATGVSVRVGGVAAYYNCADDFIQMPPQSAFFEPLAYYRTLLHEIAHALMGPHRLNVGLPGRENAEERAFAEITAELVSAFVCRAAGLDLAVRPSDYIAEWLAVLRSIRRVVTVDPRWVLEVAHPARDVAKYLFSFGEITV